MHHEAFASLDLRLAAQGHTVRWSNVHQLVFSVAGGSCHWSYDGIELGLYAFRMPGKALPVNSLVRELETAREAIANARAQGATVKPVVVPEPPPAPIAYQRPKAGEPGYDPFDGIDYGEDYAPGGSIFGRVNGDKS